MSLWYIVVGLGHSKTFRFLYLRLNFDQRFFANGLRLLTAFFLYVRFLGIDSKLIYPEVDPPPLYLALEPLKRKLDPNGLLLGKKVYTFSGVGLEGEGACGRN